MQKPVSLPFAQMTVIYDSKGKPDSPMVHPEFEIVSVSTIQESSLGHTEEMVIRRKEDGEFFSRKIPHTAAKSYFDNGTNDMSRYFVIFHPHKELLA